MTFIKRMIYQKTRPIKGYIQVVKIIVITLGITGHDLKLIVAENGEDIMHREMEN